MFPVSLGHNTKVTMTVHLHHILSILFSMLSDRFLPVSILHYRVSSQSLVHTVMTPVHAIFYVTHPPFPHSFYTLCSTFLLKLPTVILAVVTHFFCTRCQSLMAYSTSPLQTGHCHIPYRPAALSRIFCPLL